MTDLSGGDLRVLVADDDPDQRLILRELFSRAGMLDVTEVEDGEAAVRAVAERRFDLIVLDLAMPVRSGVEVLPDLREGAPSAQVVVLSNFPRWRLHGVVRQRGAVGYVEKRVRPDRLVSEILVAAELAERAGTRATSGFSATTEAAGDARRFVKDLIDFDEEGLIQSVELLVSELVSNAVLHAASAPTVSVHLTADTIRVEVYDDHPGHPRPRDPDRAGPGGRGLLLVDRIASRWGSDPSGEGKVVWFELERRPSSGSS